MIELSNNQEQHTVKVNSITAHSGGEQFQINCNIVLNGHLRRLNILLSKELLEKALSLSKSQAKREATIKRLGQILEEKDSYSYLNTDRWFGKPMILENCILNLKKSMHKPKANSPIELIGMNSEK